MKKQIEYALVQQREEWDCVIAGIATWTGRSYEEVLEAHKLLNAKVKHHAYGLSDFDSDRILFHFGMHPFTIDQAYGAVPGLLDFPSVNFPGRAHCVFYTGYDILDPNTGRDGKVSYAKRSDLAWPGCYKITIDLNDSYSFEMADFWLQEKNQRYGKACTPESAQKRKMSATYQETK
jgi:hypothetical protein